MLKWFFGLQMPSLKFQFLGIRPEQVLHPREIPYLTQKHAVNSA